MKMLASDLLRHAWRKSCTGETVKMGLALGVVTLLGVGVAAAAIGFANPADRPLSYAPALSIGPAYGDDDEDCIKFSRRPVLHDGRVRISRGVICRQ